MKVFWYFWNWCACIGFLATVFFSYLLSIYLEMKYWPGTKIVKSDNNAFNWNTGEPCCMSTLSRQIEFTKRSVAMMVEQRKKEGNKFYASPTNEFVTYSRAKAIRFAKTD